MRTHNTVLVYVCYLFIALFYSCDNETYEGDLISDIQPTCTEATAISDIALNSFLNADSSTIEDNCLAYISALEQQLISCPETSAQILEQIDNLDDCELNSFFKVDFDDDTYLANSAEAHIGNGLLTINGRRDNEEFELILHQSTEGTYQLGIADIGGNTNIASYLPDTNLNESWVSTSDGNELMGEVTISEIDYSNLKISGTFSFTGLNNNVTKAFTNGIFINIDLTKDNDFFALVDGVEFEDVQFLKFTQEQDEILALIFINEANTSTMDFTLHLNTAPGVYNFRLSPELPRAGFTSNPDFYYYANGTLTITAHNTNKGFIMGTFSFIAELDIGTPESYSITEGSFCLNYL
jgi:hypothetical protein